MAKGGPERTPIACRLRVADIRIAMRAAGREDPLSQGKYNIDVVDLWLSSLTGMSKEDLENWLGIQGNGVVDPTLLEIIKEHV